MKMVKKKAQIARRESIKNPESFQGPYTSVPWTPAVSDFGVGARDVRVFARSETPVINIFHLFKLK